MISVDYYWAKAEEALEKADTQALLGNFFTSIALAYRMLASSEVDFRKRFPDAASRPLKPQSGP